MNSDLRLSVAAWASWDGQSDEVVTGGAVGERPALPASLRRRVTPMGRKALELAWSVLPEDGQGGEPPRLVLASRHGEYERTFGLLDGLAQSGEVSPADFSLSVHHALVGLLSIATGNRQGHCAVAAGTDSCGYGLLEAATFTAEQGRSSLLIAFDGLLPDIYAPVAFEPCPYPSAVAMLLVPPGQKAALHLDMRMEPRGQGAEICLQQELRAVLSRGGERLARGGRHDWRWRHEA